MPAALIGATVRASLRAQVDHIFDLAVVMANLNHMLCRDTQDSEFVTLFYGVLDLRRRRLTYCNAGHPPALLLRDGAVSQLANDNMLLGVLAEAEYTQGVVDLQPEDRLLIYTDGLMDAENFKGEHFGNERIMEAFTRPATTARAASDHILWEMRRFMGLAKRADDVTFIQARITE